MKMQITRYCLSSGSLPKYPEWLGTWKFNTFFSLMGVKNTTLDDSQLHISRKPQSEKEPRMESLVYLDIPV